jgi:hypothetical protein
MSEVGKYGKSIGVPHPRDVRRAPALPDRATPAMSVKHVVPKPWGYSYRFAHPWRIGKSRPILAWFKTEAARDQSLQRLIRKNETATSLYRAMYSDIRTINP